MSERENQTGKRRIPLNRPGPMPGTLRKDNADNCDRHVWQITAARDLIIFFIVAGLFWLFYLLSEVFLPVVIAAVLAEVFNPFVTYIQRSWGWPRPLVAGLIVVFVIAAVLGFFAWLGPLLYSQFISLTDKLPDYLTTLAGPYGVDFGQLIDQVQQWIRNFQNEPRTMIGQIFSTTGHAVGIVATVLSTAANIFLSFLLVFIYFFLFSWHFNTAIATAKELLPHSRKEQMTTMFARMDAAIGDFFRGRLAIALIVGILLSAGWFVTGVPYWLFLGMLTGVLNIIPFLAIVTWPVAVLLKYVDSLSAGSGADAGFLAVVVWPSLVYGVVQFLDGWILTPWVQSGQTNMSAATVLIVVFIGGAAAGLWGMLFAIPVAACIKILVDEFVLPRLRAWAATH
jgi:predicted PurR-regulated permease PerM